MNSGNLPTNDDDELPEKTPLTAQEEPLLESKAVNNTITSLDSTLSNSDNCSDIELSNIDSKDILNRK